MRKTNWLFLLSLGSGSVTLAAGLLIWLTLQNPNPPPVHLPDHADAKTYAHLALDLADQERYADAINANTRALSYNPNDADLLYNQGWLAARLGRPMQALMSLDKALARAPQDPEIQYTRAWVLQKLGRNQEAQAALKMASRIVWQPKDAYAQGRLLQLQNQHAAALKAFAQVLKARPVQSASFWYWRSRSEQALHQSKAALADLSQAIGLKPSASLYQERAHLYQELGQTREALADLITCQKLEPSKENRLAQIQLQLTEDPATGQAELAALLKDQPNWLPAQLLQIHHQIDNHQLKPAQKALSAFQKSHPANAEVWGLQALLYRNQRKYAEAGKALEKAQSTGLNPAEVNLEWARLAVQQGNKSEARSRTLQALQLQPELRPGLQNDRLLKKILKSL